MREVWKRQEIDSPCKKICIIHQDHKICIGCFRSLWEISNWSKFDQETRSLITKQLKDRIQKLKPRRRGGRVGRRP
ncbi:MAG: DUF1289 domain-containing protein [Pseudomonadota bacterium]|nr:DUF1289 domain-containing protein [Pseudomonadota bacterium]